MGAVYESLHKELGKRVAIKVLLPPACENPAFRARFLREGQAASRIRHPHIVDIYDVGEEDGISYLVMEFLEGEDLLQLLRRVTILSVSRAVDIMLPVISAIGAAHKEGVIHRDLKPGNIFLTRGLNGEAVPKVLDFGISKITNDSAARELTQTGAVMGTPFYMSPEQALGGAHVDERSDQFSLAVIFYQCVTGKRPFEADSMYSVLHNIVEGVFPRPREVAPDLPEALELAMLRAMSREPAGRFPDVMGFGTAILPYASARGLALWTGVFDETTADEVSPTAITEMRPKATILEMTESSPSVLADPSLADEATGVTSHGALSRPPEESSRGIDVRLRWMLVGTALLAFAAALSLLYVFDRRGDVVYVRPEPQRVEAPPAEPAPAVSHEPEAAPPRREPPAGDREDRSKPAAAEPVRPAKRVRPPISPAKMHPVLKGTNDAPVLD
jgi:serine/threonine-protein kinase